MIPTRMSLKRRTEDGEVATRTRLEVLARKEGIRECDVFGQWFTPLRYGLMYAGALAVGNTQKNIRKHNRRKPAPHAFYG